MDDNCFAEVNNWEVFVLKILATLIVLATGIIRHDVAIIKPRQAKSVIVGFILDFFLFFRPFPLTDKPNFYADLIGLKFTVISTTLSSCCR